MIRCLVIMDRVGQIALWIRSCVSTSTSALLLPQINRFTIPSRQITLFRKDTSFALPATFQHLMSKLWMALSFSRRLSGMTLSLLIHLQQLWSIQGSYGGCCHTLVLTKRKASPYSPPIRLRNVDCCSWKQFTIFRK